MNGFYISKLSVQGINVQPAEIKFQKGANLITGDSDTGKSYIFSAINYVLGRSQEPEDIKEGKGYNLFFLEIGTYTDDVKYTLLRQSGKNEISVKQCSLELFLTADTEKKSYKTTGSISDDKHISTFLLDLCDLKGKKLLQNKKKGKTINLGFSTISKFTFVSEERIITKESPFYFSGNSKFLCDQSFLSLILTGVDASDVQPKEDKQLRETRITGKLEYVAKLIGEYSTKREEIVKQSQAFKGIRDTKDVIAKLDEQLQAELNQAKSLTNSKNILISERASLIRESGQAQELITRFQILEKQYNSDYRRLEFILEGETLSAQLGDVVCPVCSSQIENDHLQHLQEVENFRISAQREMEKIKSKVLELQSALQLLLAKKSEYQRQTEINKLSLVNIENELSKNLKPKIATLNANINKLLEQENIVSHLCFIDAETKNLYSEKDRLEKALTQKEETDDTTMLQYTELSDLSEFIQKRLQAWNYEPEVLVNFDSHYKVFDIDISGKKRRSYGKGKRSISYSACIIGVLDYCLSKGLSYPNIVLLDSPLTTFEEKRGMEKTSKEKKAIQQSFFKNISEQRPTSQIIIFDNKEPAEDVGTGLHIQVFTGEPGNGRFGFFPV